MNEPCLVLPFYFWDLGDGGNRQALALCRHVCPALVGCDAEAKAAPPDGVILGGVAYEKGVPLPVCVCGYPADGTATGGCRHCMVSDRAWLDLHRAVKAARRSARRMEQRANTRRYTRVAHREADIRRLAAEERLPDEAIAKVLRCSRNTIRNIRHSANPPIPSGRPPNRAGSPARADERKAA